jgi:hypothetical protein
MAVQPEETVIDGGGGLGTLLVTIEARAKPGEGDWKRSSTGLGVACLTSRWERACGPF